VHGHGLTPSTGWPATRPRPIREKAPSSSGHFSENPSLDRFAATGRRRPAGSAAGLGRGHSPRTMFWFPRDCRRGCIWPTPATTTQDKDRFFRPDRSRPGARHRDRWLGNCWPPGSSLMSCPSRVPSARGGRRLLDYRPARRGDRSPGHQRPDRQARRRRNRIADHAVDLAVSGGRSRTPRLALALTAAQRRPVPRTNSTSAVSAVGRPALAASPSSSSSSSPLLAISPQLAASLRLGQLAGLSHRALVVEQPGLPGHLGRGRAIQRGRAPSRWSASALDDRPDRPRPPSPDLEATTPGCTQ